MGGSAWRREKRSGELLLGVAARGRTALLVSSSLLAEPAVEREREEQQQVGVGACWAVLAMWSRIGAQCGDRPATLPAWLESLDSRGLRHPDRKTTYQRRSFLIFCGVV